MAAKYYLSAPANRPVRVLWRRDEFFWQYNNGKFVQVGPGNTFDSLKAITLNDGGEFVEGTLSPGEYYPRMARPSYTDAPSSPGFNPENLSKKDLIETGRGQLVALREQLEKIFRTVHPTEKNFGAFGHDIRNLLILAATEVEAQLKGILKANGIDGSTTNEYVKLLAAMKLDEYAIKLPFYPWLSPLKPFGGWSSAAPTKSLPWYDSYNAVKHDRESLFERGTLLHAIEAVCACAVLTFAQFGRNGFHDARQLLTFFHLVEVPTWNLKEVYIILPDPAPLVPVPYPF